MKMVMEKNRVSKGKKVKKEKTGKVVRTDSLANNKVKGEKEDKMVTMVTRTGKEIKKAKVKTERKGKTVIMVEMVMMVRGKKIAVMEKGETKNKMPNCLRFINSSNSSVKPLRIVWQKRAR